MISRPAPHGIHKISALVVNLNEKVSHPNTNVLSR